MEANCSDKASIRNGTIRFFMTKTSFESLRVIFPEACCGEVHSLSSMFLLSAESDCQGGKTDHQSTDPNFLTSNPDQYRVTPELQREKAALWV
ncbi:MAG: hypothetical protein Q8M86_06870 [Syntrophales bacterium]|nr:hypothetical protein [Syntrophales bacterium]MDP3097650.1 hypothetical protein [Syntrophales bacterium]